MVINLWRQPQTRDTLYIEDKAHLEVHQRLHRPRSLFTSKDRRLAYHMCQTGMQCL